MRRETLRWKRGRYGHPFNFLDFAEGTGQVISGDLPEIADQRRDATLASSDLLAVSTLGQLAENPRVVALRAFIEGWYLSYLSSNDARGTPDAGPMERLSQSGEFMEQGAELGALWMEGHLSAGDPLLNSHIKQVVRN